MNNEENKRRVMKDKYAFESFKKELGSLAHKYNLTIQTETEYDCYIYFKTPEGFNLYYPE